MKKTVSLIVAVLAALTSSLFAQGIGWTLMNAKIRSEFPDVPRLQTSELAKTLNNPREQKPLLLDVRTKAEFDVSHLAGATRVEPGSDVSKLSLPKDKPIVTYCSVGYRSAAMAKKLREAGYTRVTNLEGSIFRWADENRPLVHDGQPTDKVHPYNAVWGMLVDKAHRAENAPPAAPSTAAP
ncbi:MAG: rhodanese-like domain-containing protein [Chthoniobacterales bacterium]